MTEYGDFSSSTMICKFAVPNSSRIFHFDLPLERESYILMLTSDADATCATKHVCGYRSITLLATFFYFCSFGNKLVLSFSAKSQWLFWALFNLNERCSLHR